MSEALALIALLKAVADMVEAAGQIIKLPDTVPAEQLDQIDAERERLVAQAQALDGSSPSPPPAPAPSHYHVDA